jgi:hypothetical protein
LNFNLRRYDEEFAASDPTQVLKQSAAVTVVMQGSALRESISAASKPAGTYTRPLLSSPGAVFDQ